MEEPLCRDCQDLGSQTKATRFIGKTPVCDMHMRKRLGQLWTPPTSPLGEVRKEKSMQGRKPPDLDWSQLQKERDAGVSVEELRKKYKTSWATVNKHTSAPRNGTRHAGGGKNFGPLGAEVPSTGISVWN